MDAFYFDLAKAAEWIYNHRNSPQYWEWEDLTDLNPSTDNLNLNKAVAWNICTVLESKGLVRFMDTFEKDGRKRYPFRIDLSDEKAWKHACKPPTKWNRFCRCLGKLWAKFGLFVVGALSLSVTSILIYGLQRLIDIKWPAP